jgi:hypothetical protein
MEGNTMQLASKFTAAEINAVIEADRRGEIKLPAADYNDKTLTAELDRQGWKRTQGRIDVWQSIAR